jgi:hypothetical protein
VAGAVVFFLSGFVWFELVAVRVFAFLSVPVFWESVIGLDLFFFIGCEFGLIFTTGNQ